MEERRLTEHEKAMGKTGRDVELAFVFGREVQAVPFAERWRVAADVHRYVEYFPLQDLEQFALRNGILTVQAAQGAAA